MIIDKPGTYTDVEAESIIVRADEVTLIRPHVDGKWKDDNPYGIQVAYRKDGRPYGRCEIRGGEVTGAWRKGILCQLTYIRGVEIHHCGSDGVFCNLPGAVVVRETHIHHLGRDEGASSEQQAAHQDRTGKPGSGWIHGDGIQVPGGKWYSFRDNKIEMRHGYGDYHSANAGIFVKGDFDDVRNLDVIRNEISGALYNLRIMDGNRGHRVTRAHVRGLVSSEPWYAAYNEETREPVDFRAHTCRGLEEVGRSKAG